MHRRCARMASVGRPDAQVFVLFFYYFLILYQNIFEIRKNNFAKIFNYSRNIFYLFLEIVLFQTILRIIFPHNLNLCFINRLFQVSPN